MDVLELIRDRTHFPQPVANKTLQAGDILIVRARLECLLRVKEVRGIQILPEVEFGSAAISTSSTTQEEGIAKVLILPNAEVVGSTITEMRFRQRYLESCIAPCAGISSFCSRG
jgi:uncharacterized protein with PhoU and TrkA domain